MANIPEQPLSFAEVLNLYKRNEGNPAVKDMTLPDFSSLLNEASGTELFSAGLKDSKIKRASVAFDELLAKTGVPQAAGEAFAGFGEMISPRFKEPARHIGESLPRSVIEFAGLPLLAAGGPVAAIGAPLVAAGVLSSGARAYTDTGSPAAGVVAGVSNLLLPVAGKLGARFLTGQLSKAVATAEGANIASRIVDLGGHALGQTGLMELAGQASSALSGHGLYNPLSPENIFTHVANQLAFAPLTVVGAIRGPKPGEFKSVGQELLAIEKTKEAARQTEAKKYIKTSEDSLKGISIEAGNEVVVGEQKIQFDEGVPVGGLPAGVKELTAPIARAGTFFGHVTEPKTGAFFKGVDEGQIGKAAGAGRIPTFPETEVANVADALSKALSIEGPQAAKAAGDVANAAAVKAGDPPPLNDKVVADHVEQHLSDGLNEQQALQRVEQTAKAVATEEVKKLTTKERNEQQAAERLAALPDDVKNFLGEGIAKVDRRTSSDRLSDFSAAKLIQAALNWLDSKKPDPAMLGAKSPERGKLAKDLEGFLATATKKTQRAAGEELAKTSIDEVDTPSSDIPDNVSPATAMALQEAENDFANSVTGVLRRLISGEAPFTKQEAEAVGVKSDKTHLGKLTAVARDVALTGSFGDVGTGSKKGFRFRPSNETIAAFGQLKEETIQKFVRDNWKDVRKLIEGRLEGEGIELSATSPLVRKQVRAFLLDEQPVFEQGSFAPAVKKLFFDQFRFMGHDPATAATFANVAERVALTFRDIDRIRIAALVDRTVGAESRRSSVMGVAIRQLGNNETGVVGINFLERMSKTPIEFASFAKLATLGHEVYHQLWNIGTSQVSGPANQKRFEVLKALNDRVESMPVEDRRAYLRSAYEALVPSKILENEEARAHVDSMVEYGSGSTQEFIAEYAGLLALGAASPNSVKANSWNEFLAYSDKQMSDFAFGMYTDLREVSGALSDLVKIAHTGEAPSKEASTEFFGKVHEAFGELVKTKTEIQSAVDELGYLASNEPGAWMNLAERGTAGRIAITDHASMMKHLKKLFPGAEEHDFAIDYARRSGLLKMDKELEKQFGKSPNWFEGNFAIPAHLRELYPMLADVTRLVMDFRGLANNTTTRGMTPFGTVDALGHVRFDKNAPIVKVRSDPKLEKAVSEIFLEQNWQKKPLSREEVNGLEHFGRLTAAEQETVWTVAEQTRKSMELMANEISVYQKKTIADAVAGIILHGHEGMKAKTAISTGELLVDRLEKRFTAKEGEATDVLDAGVVLASQGLDPQVMQRVLAAFKVLYPKYQKLQQAIDAHKSYYTPETRLGDYYLRYVKDGKRHFVGFDDKESLVARLESLRNDPTVQADSVKAIDKWQKNRDVNTLYTDIAGVFTDVEKSAYEIALQAMAAKDPSLAETAAKLYQPGEATFKEIAVRGFGRHFQERKLVAGREEINMMQGVVAYIEGMSMGMAKAVTKRRSGLLLMDPELKQNPDVRHLGRDYVVTVTDPPAREWATVKEMGFQYYLGANPTSVVIETFQPLFTLAPELTRQGAGVVGGYRLIGEAAKTLFKLSTKQSLPPEWRIAEALKKAEDNQKIGLGVFQELEGLDADSTIANLRRASLNAEDMTSPAAMVKKPLYWWGQLTKGIYRSATARNDRIAFLSGYLMKIKSGASFEDAYDFGVRVKENAMFSGGAASRPIGLFSRTGKLYGAVGALYSLRHYTMSMFSDIYRMAHDSLNTSGLPKEDVSAARKALTQMMVTQVGMAGALGLPMASGAVAVLEQLFPNLEVKKALRTGIASLAGEDEEMGQLLSDLALKGVISAATPIDVSSRFGLGDAFGLDPNKGFDAAQVFGVPGSLFQRGVDVIQSGTQGDFGTAAKQLLPNAFGGLVKTYQDGGVVRDKAGHLIYTPDEVEVALAAIGFKPKRLSQFREQQAIMGRSEEIATRKMRQFHDGLSQLLEQGQGDSVRQALIAQAELDDTYDPRAGLRAVVEGVLDRNLPKELGATGPRGAIRSNEAVRSAFPQQPPVSEVQRAVMRSQLESSVGVSGAGHLSRHELTTASLVDRLRLLNPGLTRQHALLLAERLQAKNPSNTASLYR